MLFRSELCVGRADEDACATEVMTPLVGRIGRALDSLRSLSTDDSRFKEKLDLMRVGIVGHSFGGAQAAQFCSQDPRCTVGIDIDGRLFSSIVQVGLSVPFMRRGKLLGDQLLELAIGVEQRFGNMYAHFAGTVPPVEVCRSREERPGASDRFPKEVHPLRIRKGGQPAHPCC